jgi:iron complex outermembrane receptor protein
VGFDPGLLPAYSLVDLNLNWNSVAGRPIDLAIFATNIANKRYAVAIGQSLAGNSGYETALYGLPRMYGVRLKFRFSE